MSRPPKYTTPEDRLTARRAQKAAYKRRKRAGGVPLRPFLCYDGEGTGDRYLLLGNSLDHVYSKRGLRTRQSLEYLSAEVENNPIRVFFAMGYDVAQVVRDLPLPLQVELYHSKPVKWEAWELLYYPRKLLEVRRDGRRVTYFDVWTFFHSSLEKALKLHLSEVPAVISEGKAARSRLGGWSEGRIRAYHQAECVWTERLLDKLREAFQVEALGLPKLVPASWHGPGAVAGRVLRAANVGREVYPERGYSDELRDVFARAYFGGRIETFVMGKVRRPIYRYDIRSAYPAAIRELPRLGFKWYWARRFDPAARFSVWRVAWDLRGYPSELSAPGPFPWRDAKGYIYFRAEGEGWYWWPEVLEALKLYRGVRVLEGYVMRPTGSYPLREIVDQLYDVRSGLQNVQDPREHAVKLALNSLYGKMAQKDGSARFRSIAWAGYVTSWTRAQVLRAMATCRAPLYAVLTDGILAGGKLDVPLGDNLGEWELTKYPEALILLPGVYRLGRARSSERVERWRGYNVRTFPFARVVREVRDLGEASLRCPLFVSPPLANLGPQAYGPHLRRFITVRRTVNPLGQHKRAFALHGVPDGKEGPNLSRTLLTSRMVASPRAEWPGLSEPYTAFTMDELNAWERAELEDALGQL